jgi:ribosomal protein S18 acetylase RimI-like enzyme
MANSDIQKATPDDIPTLVGLMREFYAEASFPLPERAASRAFGGLIADPALGQVWLIRSEGEPAGFVVLTICYSMEYGGLRGFIDDFFVAPAFRRRGLGAAALDTVKEECAARGVRVLLVETGHDNDAALGTYRRAGLKETDHLLLALPLASPVHEG